MDVDLIDILDKNKNEFSSDEELEYAKKLLKGEGDRVMVEENVVEKEEQQVQAQEEDQSQNQNLEKGNVRIAVSRQDLKQAILEGGTTKDIINRLSDPTPLDASVLKNLYVRISSMRNTIIKKGIYDVEIIGEGKRKKSYKFTKKEGTQE